jgi:hypothetical protein
VADAARAAFVSGFHVSVLVGACIVAVGILSVLRWLPARARDVEIEMTGPAADVVRTRAPALPDQSPDSAPDQANAPR